MKRKDLLKSKKQSIQKLSLVVTEAKALNSLENLNETLRQIIMGPFGDTKYDEIETKETISRNVRWRKSRVKTS